MKYDVKSGSGAVAVVVEVDSVSRARGPIIKINNASNEK